MPHSPLKKASLHHVNGMVEAFCGAMEKSSRPFLPAGEKEKLQMQQTIIYNNLFKNPLYESQQIVVAEDDKGLVKGFIFFWQPSSVNVHIEELFTDKNNFHAGTWLLSHAALFAENARATEMTLQSYVEAMPFYKKYGFVEAGTTYDRNMWNMKANPKDVLKLTL